MIGYPKVSVDLFKKSENETYDKFLFCACLTSVGLAFFDKLSDLLPTILILTLL